VSIQYPSNASADTKWLMDEVNAILERNRQRGTANWCGYDYDFTCPSFVTYPFQWFWDSCFHAISASYVDIQKGELEIKSLLRNQHPDGFISHVTFWQRDAFEEMVSTYAIAFRSRYLSDEMQPPLLAEAVAAVAERGRGVEFINEVLPQVKAFYEWLHKVRNPYGDGLIRVVQPDETGIDHSPKWDGLMQIKEITVDEFNAGWNRICKPYEAFNRDPKKMIELNHFVVADVMTNTIYIENLRVLAQLCIQVGDTASADEYLLRADKAKQSLMNLCWDEEIGLFFDVANQENTPLQVNTFTSLMPLLLGDLDPVIAEALIEHVTNPKEYWAPYPIPSVAMNEPSFLPGTAGNILVWRGPTWINSNWYLARGLMRHGRSDLARVIADKSLELVRKHGFREYYNPLTTQGHGAPDFSWSTILVDLFILTRNSDGS
jgi:hypothetical protein